MNIKNLRKKYQPDESKRLKPIFHRYCNKIDWKRPFNATVETKEKANKLSEAIRWFHASEPKIVKVSTTIRHKQGLISMQGKSMYRVTSKGYQA